MMKKNLKRTLIEYGIFGALMLTLFLTGLHTEVFAFIQRGMLKTGIMNPDVEKTEAPADVDAKDPKADFNMNLINSKGEKVNMEEFRRKVIFINI